LFVVLMAKAHAVVCIEQCTTVPNLNTVMRVHTMLGRCPCAPMAVAINVLALITSTGKYQPAPGAELGCVVEAIALPRRQLCGAEVAGRDQRRKGAKMGHRGSSWGAGALVA
jgi:hypothetical protein